MLTGLLLAVVAALASTALLGLAGWFIVRSAQSGLATTSPFSWFYPSAGVEALAVVRTTARYGERLSTHRATLDLLARVRTRLFSAASRLPAARMRGLRSGALLDRVHADVDTLDGAILSVAVPGVVCGVVAVGGVAVLAIVRPVFGIAGGVVLLLALAADLGISLGSRRLGERLAAQRSAAAARLVEAMDGRAELASFGAVGLAARELRERFDALAVPRRNLTAREAAGTAVIAVGRVIALGCVLAVGTGLWGRPVDPAVLAFVVLVTAALFDAATGLGSAGQAFAEARVAWRRLREVAAVGFTRPTDTDPDTDADTDADTVAEAVPGGDLTLRDLVAGYGGTPAVEITSLDLPRGTFAVLTGPSGAGKSTLLSVLAGELAPTSGSAKFGEFELPVLDYPRRVATVTLVEQDSGILSGTVADNLRLARPDATADELAQALEVAALSGAVELSTEVGPAGAHLSGGQRRRLAIAQAYLRRPRLLLLDEPSEGLDATTARVVLANLRAALPHTTIIAAIHDRTFAHLPLVPDTAISLRPDSDANFAVSDCSISTATGHPTP
ncbi:MAG TPA: ATP-binding cassette domain-containing protein [Amycolatopsis sp.]|nr:ATP-binding cassette domain-containing protein [Amycolatopsis sp.]